ncbi:hypothetical protein [Flagellimonas nanhaiensis]|uniref:DUF4175 family protein n=1 Tax=Flagellimonas nanhaiensis TaxID=2292706 RepID=A0A371JQM1_9FLAO|nr:hypothetical protein [Allomuricauda nanhaiensis]RDY59810.1 hypothetical protein DX873_10670 [Allomuricauda nanhaiensis]
MDSYQKILDKLNGFIKKYYTKRLVKGILLFLTLGLLFWIAVTSMEHLFWLNQKWRLTLFVLFLGVEIYLLYKFIGEPLAYLFKLKKGITHMEASRLIGLHFPKVNDKLMNLMEFADDSDKSELLLASIDQRARLLGPVPFTEAVDVKESLRYARYLLAPLAVFGLLMLSGNVASFFESHQRVLNYDMAYERPAPFSFRLLNEDLEVLDNESLTIAVAVDGEMQPENVYMVVNGEQLLLQKNEGVFSHNFSAPVETSSFYLTANGWDSKTYSIVTHRTPRLVDFKMQLKYPSYLNREAEIISGSGNAVVPEGTRVTWNVKGNNVEEIGIASKDTMSLFEKDDSDFTHSQNIYADLRYELRTSNEFIKDYEKLSYSIDVVNDDRPTVVVEQSLDSLRPNQSFYRGEAKDDYGINRLHLVCYPVDDRSSSQRILLETPGSDFHRFYYTFPSGLDLEEGRSYRLYFEVVDNDGLRGGKVARSKEFDANYFDNNQLIKRELSIQNSVVKSFEGTLKKYKEQSKTLKEIQREQKESKALNFEDKNQIKDFIKKQEQQDELMEKFSQQLKESLSRESENEETRKMLQERLERQELEARKNEKLLEELNKLTEKINEEEFKKKLEELGKKQSSNAKSLEQILELTKRYYVTEKASQLSKELENMAKRQKLLSELKLGEDFSDKEQKRLNEDFEELSKELDELKKDNEGLQKPMDLEIDKKKSEEVKQDQKDALEEINKHQGSEESSTKDEKKEAGDKASKKQKSAADKMKEMSESLKQGAMGGGGSSITEDAEMLRQILDNLVTFSFKQEALFDKVENIDIDISQFSRTVKEQKELRRLFEHVDDSLFALSLRRAELSEFVNEQITEVYYNIDKALESIADNQVFQGASYQQYVMNATNSLAEFLADVLDNMQQSMNKGQGSGSGSDFQLPDIIQRQQDVQEKMNGKGQQGQKGGQEEKGSGEGKEGEGEQGKQEGGGKEGGKKDGEQGGNESGQGSEGNDGSSGSEMGLQEVYEIYKEQQFLRQQLEKQLEDMINNQERNLAKKLVKQMGDFENDLLENGITERTKNKANYIQHQLLKLENASLQQGETEERKSDNSQELFTNPITTKPEIFEDYKIDVEILNRQALPLRRNYEKKVKVYFKDD